MRHCIRPKSKENHDLVRIPLNDTLPCSKDRDARTINSHEIIERSDAIVPNSSVALLRSRR
jgi:hypothetical protein